MKGRWKYLYRAIDKDGATLDFYLADRRNTKAAKRFLGAALRRSRDWTGKGGLAAGPITASCFLNPAADIGVRRSVVNR